MAKEKKGRRSRKKDGVTGSDRWVIFVVLAGSALLSWWFWSQR